jgi:hypothetical protein
MRSVVSFSLGLFLLSLLPLWAQENNPKTSSKAYLKADRRTLSLSEQNRIEELANERNRAVGNKREYGKGSFLSDLEKNDAWVDRLFYTIFVACLFLGAFVLAYNYMLGLTANREAMIRKREAELKAQEQANIRRILDS